MGFDKTKVVRTAEKYLSQGKIPAAIQEYRRIVEHDAEDFSALNTLGDLYARVDKKQDALACYRRVADHYREQGFTLKAIAMYKKCTRLSASDHHTAMALASLYEQQGLMADARAQYLIAADLHARAGNTRESLEVLSRIADLDPGNTEVRLRLAEGYARESLSDQAADSFTEAGERLSARGEYEQALDAYTKALSIRPRSHAALHGLVAAHTALGTADEAAEVLEEAIAGSPGDLELRALLARAYIEAENAAQAERTIEQLVASEPSNYPLFFDIVPLYLQQGNPARSVYVLGAVLEPALAGRQDEKLLELLQEVLARDPEQMQALHLLVRVHAWQRDDERLRTALERLADAAETAGLQDEERKALAQLVRLAADESRYAERLESLGGPLPEDMAADAQGAQRADGEVPTFESFMLDDETLAAPAATSQAAHDSSEMEFEWNTVASPSQQANDPGISFADLNDTFENAGNDSYNFSGAGAAASSEPPTFENFQEVSFDAPVPAGGTREDVSGTGDTRAEQMLLQELESVDFYIAQGYLDIARDTLELVEGQYGSHPQIEARRKVLSNADAVPVTTEPQSPAETVEAAPETFEFTDFSSYDLTPEVLTPADVSAPQFEQSPPAQEESAIGNAQPPLVSTPPPAAHDESLAAFFDEFREAVEDAETPVEADYETHYNMGLAYREMGLLDQSIEELQKAIDATTPGDGTPRYLQCCNLLGHCFMEKGMPRAAVIWFRKGLDAPGHTDDEYQALRFELGTAYEQMGDLERAIEVFTEVYGINVSYRGVSNRLRELLAQKERLEARG